jgi:hypothetical protein
MKIVKVTYKSKPEFAATNQVNIKAVMAELQARQYPGIHYHVCVGPDGVSFIHTAFFKSDEDQQLLNDLPEFKYFQQQLKAGGLDTPPQQELLTLVGSSNPLFSD